MSQGYTAKAWEELLSLTVENAAAELERHLAAAFDDVSLERDCGLADGEESSVDLLRHWLLNGVAEAMANQGVAGTCLVEELPGLCFLCTTPEMLRASACSGGCADWLAAVHVLDRILQERPDLVSDVCSCQHKLALAIALCFADKTATDENMREGPIDPLQRFEIFCALANEEALLGDTSTCLSTWHWRYVIGSWHSDEDLAWARETVNEDIRCTDKIGQAARMIKYTETNPEGVSVQEGLKFYSGKKSTMQVIHAEGGVCGAISKFGTSACQAFGVPAMPIAQPGHCALIWRNNTTGEWSMENANDGWQSSNMHVMIQRTWPELGLDSAAIIPVMENAQASGNAYHISEQRRLAAVMLTNPRSKAALLGRAIAACKYNMPAWSDFFRCEEDETARLAVMKDVVGVLREGGAADFALLQPIQASADWDLASRVVDGTDSEWFPVSSHRQWLEVRLLAPCAVEEVRVRWWGDYGKKTHLRLFSRTAPTQEFQLRGELAPKDDSAMNGWASFPGWSDTTTQVRLELSSPAPDCFNLKKSYGVRRLVVLGYRAEDVEQSVTLQEAAAFLFSAPGPADGLLRRYLASQFPSEQVAQTLLKPLRPSDLKGVKPDNWLTFGAPGLAKSSGCFYHEVKLGAKIRDTQLGWAALEFREEAEITGNGIGDDEHSYAADGQRQLRWHKGESVEVSWPSEWKEGDVVGCAIDFDAGEMTFSLNGEWVPEATIEFEPSGREFYPALSLKGGFAMFLPARAWVYDPPTENFQAWLGPDADQAAYRSPLL
mmetsp:Transcript_35315/g.82464  ORF Transcript_35315/g.82464 Transcript_35315/m.82464 type:complete len:777 (+) Transcript_35315:108-2438(+)|eukprot:CAMPEP_0178374480 /NCGR_PEP_ID=MMETSP0689_2-20121128/2398_1 /TAXON_ID=160604 /ORGANISM="Amphidinium massartii, Strain CS-259" /LENGTH=776 /DNA_ID=CAMNT_0019994451 /DNA_START=20 /DNA_END=2350 /DNA_ORIENTATION=+